MRHFTPTQLKDHLADDNQALTLLDVREPWEFDACKISNSLLIPMGTIPDNIDQLSPDKPIVVICHHGIRSAKVAIFLEHHGFDMINLTGGVAAWAEEVDPNMPTY